MRALLCYVAGGSAVGATFAVSVDLTGLARVYEFMLISYAPAPGKLGTVLLEVWSWLPPPLILFPAAALLAWQGRRLPGTVLATLPLLPLLVAWPFRDWPLWRAPLPFVASRNVPYLSCR